MQFMFASDLNIDNLENYSEQTYMIAIKKY